MEYFLQGLFFFTLAYFFITYTLQFIFLVKIKKQELNPIGELGISVVVCANNEEENLRTLIPLLLSQDYAIKEIIIVDDRSHDGTYDYLLELKPTVKLVRIEQVPDHANGKKFGLTMGIKAATYDRVVFTDADCRPASNQWLAEVSATFTEEQNFVLGYSQYQVESGFLNQFIRFETITTALHYFMRAKFFTPYMAVGRNLAYSKRLFMEVKGFNESLKILGGDDDLFVNKHAKRRSTSLILSPSSTVYSIPKRNWSAYYTQKKRHLSVGKHYKIPDKMLLAFKSLINLLFWISFIVGLIIIKPNYYILGGFVAKFLMQGILYYSMTKKSGEKFDFWLLPVHDLFYSMYLAIMGVLAGFSKKVKWS
jgi:glycosyltransferase involved in cell wall biosynthesis